MNQTLRPNIISRRSLNLRQRGPVKQITLLEQCTLWTARNDTAKVTVTVGNIDDLSLALAQAATYLRESGLDFSSYTWNYNDNGKI